MRLSKAGACVFGLALTPAMAGAQTSFATQASYVVGQGWVKYDSPGLFQGLKYYRIGVVAGRSYCVENVASDFLADPANTYIQVVHPDQFPIGENDNMTGEPGAYPSAFAGPARFCWVATVTEDATLRLFTQESPDATYERKFRVVDTTLFSPWFFSGSGFEAFILIKNTTNQAVSATVSLYTPSGAPAGTPQTASLPPNGSFNLQVSAPSPGGFGLASASGTVQIAHTGAPGALVANVTSLSFGSGVSFDTPVSPRHDWDK